MNLSALLREAAASVDTTVRPETVRADLARGRRALARRRVRRSGVAGLLAAGALAGAALLGGGAVPPSAPPDEPPRIATAGIALVDYTGVQPAGFVVDAVPQGWVVQGVTEHALTIAPADAENTDPAQYAGKLTVLLRSTHAPAPSGGVPVRVGTTDGVVVDGGVDPDSPGAVDIGVEHLLHYVDPVTGQPVAVQVPRALGWSPEQAARFAEGVHITEEAVRGVG
ncbi:MULTISPECIES: hypothetical protein [unclassified Blastococcus]